MNQTGFLTIVGIVLIAGSSTNGLMRRCKCKEDEECREQALNSVNKCAVDCGYNLDPLGGDIKDMVNCFGDQRNALQAEDVCLRQKIGYECDDSPQSTLISEENFEKLEFTFDGPKKSSVSPFMQQIHDSLNVIFNYNSCIRSCYINITAECYKLKRCGYDLPDRKMLITFAKDCVGAHSLFYIEQVQACHCLLHKLHLKKLSGVCVHIGNPFLKESKPFLSLSSNFSSSL